MTDTNNTNNARTNSSTTPDELLELAHSLNPLERKILPLIRTPKYVEEIMSEANVLDIEAIRSFQWLQNKNLAKMDDDVLELIALTKKGEQCKTVFPEKTFLKEISSSKKSNEHMKKILDSQEINVCIGILKKHNLINIMKDEKLNDLVFEITAEGNKILNDGFDYEELMKKELPLDTSSLNKKEKEALELLSKRNLFEKKIIKKRKAVITSKGAMVLEIIKKNSYELVEKLTPNMMKDSSWKGKTFRRYDVRVNVPTVYGGKRHFVNQSVEYIRSIWLDLGFKEMDGELVQTSFWDLDSLFVPQDHPARQMQDTFFIKDPKFGKLPMISKKIKEVHENGGDTGSVGWGSKYSEDIARKNLLITHDTYLSAKVLASIKKEDLPVKTFQIMKVFRNEALDWKHLFEFYQIGGIVVDPDVNFKHLIGYLKVFFKKMGYKDVRIRPAFFPYTSPSAEVEVLHPVHNQWIELGGCGVFRPEVVKPLLGFDCPVLAWGLGLGRISSEYWKITDIRDLDKNDLKQIREMKIWLK